jgi:hypothetical protein
LSPQTEGCLSSEKLASRLFRELGQGKEPERLDLCPFAAWENGGKVLGTRSAGRGLFGPPDLPRPQDEALGWVYQAGLSSLQQRQRPSGEEVGGVTVGVLVSNIVAEGYVRVS